MLLEEEMVTFLRAQSGVTDLVDNRIYPLSRVQDDSTPAITYQRIYGEHAHGLSGGSGYVEVMMQLDLWGTYKETLDLDEALRKVLQGYIGTWGTTKIHGVLFLNDYDWEPDADEEKLGQTRRTIELQIMHQESQEIYHT